MFYLTKFCRICVQAGVKLVDIETLDVDSITLSEKLEACTKMVINRESFSKGICFQCIKKLRICYEFQHMCKQSTKILEGYLTELVSANKINVGNFVSSELRVTLTPLTKNNILQCKRKRITKEERCSLLKKLLSSNERVKEHDKFYQNHGLIRPNDESCKGGLRDIINFTSNYDFGYTIDKNHNLEATPLDKLTAFSNNFFHNNFNEFRQTILQIIENQNNFYDSDDDDSMFEEVCEEDDTIIKVEEVIIEPDIKIKSELEYEEECEDYAANFVETTYYDDVDVKKENMVIQDCSLQFDRMTNGVNYSYMVPNSTQSSSVNMLDNFVERFANCKTFSKHSVRCRTRDSPYINPQLKEQFQQRCFKCTKCYRYFKSPGYLKAHLAKIHH